MLEHTVLTLQIIYSSITNKMQRYTMVFITINALHVSGGSSAHHQELKTVYTASGICRAFTASYRLFTQLCNVASCWLCLNTLTMHGPINVKLSSNFNTIIRCM
jgi:hypothetical protein